MCSKGFSTPAADRRTFPTQHQRRQTWLWDPPSTTTTTNLQASPTSTRCYAQHWSNPNQQRRTRNYTHRHRQRSEDALRTDFPTQRRQRTSTRRMARQHNQLPRQDYYITTTTTTSNRNSDATYNYYYTHTKKLISRNIRRRNSHIIRRRPLPNECSAVI